MSESDVVLLESWMREGNAEAFKTLAMRYAGMVYGTCKRILNNPAEAEDTAQECFEILATTRKPVGEYLAPWLHRVACNRALTRLRSEHRRKEREAQFTADLEAGRDIAWNDIYGLVDEAIAGLPDQLRIPVVAHFLDDQTHSAIGLTLGVPRSTVTDRIDKGVELLRQALKSKGVAMTGLALTGLIKANVAEAASSTLIMNLGKLALSGAKQGAATAVATSMVKASAGVWTTKTIAAAAAAMGVLVLAAALFGGWHALNRPYDTQEITAQSTFSYDGAARPDEALAPDPPQAASQKAEATTEPALAVAENQIAEMTIYGRVVEEDGRPVSNAVVRLENREEFEQSQRLMKDSPDLDWGVPQIEVECVTDQNGRYAFPRLAFANPRFENTFRVCAQKGDFAAFVTLRIGFEFRKRRVELVMRPAASLKGRILDDTGKGVAGARLRFSPLLMRGDMMPRGLWSDADGDSPSRAFRPAHTKWTSMRKDSSVPNASGCPPIREICWCA